MVCDDEKVLPRRLLSVLRIPSTNQEECNGNTTDEHLTAESWTSGVRLETRHVSRYLNVEMHINKSLTKKLFKKNNITVSIACYTT